ncbi:hypothetical protein [Pseudomonas sp. EpS/L25]|uniref:hypothetical protein n=1 Tax=Pseudomonas sp. EpS/L25 TaxID=1749078 RepID=UPI0007441F71|nr:hypothetical protein [Pseudomonas sp. EpS/L25]KUM43570.1 hypothetical protein AR540_17415 [Pseudomonas sp. EpS/L25]
MSIDLARAVHIVEKAFLPLRGEVREDRSDASFSLAVTDGSRVLASVAHVARGQYGHAGHLAALIEQTRLELARDGHYL